MSHFNVTTSIKALIIALVVCISAPTSLVRAQEYSDDIISRIDSRMATLDSLIFTASAPAASPSALAGAIECPPDIEYAQAVNSVVNARIGAIKAQTGLQLTGQIYGRLDNALGIIEDDDAVSRYTGKIQAEARWYFLQSGLLRRKSRIEEQQLKGELSKLEHEHDRANPRLYARRERMRVISDSVLASLMQHRVLNLQLLEQAYMYLLSNENISGDDLLRVLDDRAEAERRLVSIAPMPGLAPSLSSVTVGIVTIDTTAVVEALKRTDLDLQILDTKSRILTKQAHNTTWWSDVRLAPFVRYSHYLRHLLPSSSNVDVGLSFTVPINAEASRQASALRAQKIVLDCEYLGLVERGADKVHYIALETERLNRAIVGEWQRALTLKKYLSTRRDAYNHRQGEYNRLAALKEYNSYLRCLENIVELQYRRDCCLADIQALVPAVSVLDLCTFTPLSK